MEEWKDEKVLITGVCGTVGRELLRQVLDLSPADVIGIDNNESELFFLSEECRANPNVRLFLGDIKDRDKLTRKLDGVDVVLHAAAYKHVELCERSPRDAVQTNIIGTQNVIDAALANNVERVIFTSSDKAVNPTNVMGTSKLMGERLMTAANALKRRNGPVFASTRFGNVLGSRGSVIPLFKKQIADGGPVTLTDRAMTRFIMTLQEAVGLVLRSVFMALGGEVFVTKMPIIRIENLAEVMVDEIARQNGREAGDIKIKLIGSKPGEKLYEELMNEEEVRRTVELEDFFVIKPAFTNIYQKIDYVYENLVSVKVKRPYNSSLGKPLAKNKLRGYLSEHGLLGV